MESAQLYGVALNNAANEIGKVDASPGPQVLSVHNQGAAALVISVEKVSDGSLVALREDTAVSNEDTGYDGDASTLTFSGQTLNNLPVVPGSVTVEPTAGGNSVNLTDRDGDGRLYTADNDEDFAGTINYFTGALTLAFPSGKDPAATNILCDYTYQDTTVAIAGKRALTIETHLPDEPVRIKAAANAANAEVRVDVTQTF